MAVPLSPEVWAKTIIMGCKLQGHCRVLYCAGSQRKATVQRMLHEPRQQFTYAVGNELARKYCISLGFRSVMAFEWAALSSGWAAAIGNPTGITGFCFGGSFLDCLGHCMTHKCKNSFFIITKMLPSPAWHISYCLLFPVGTESSEEKMKEE